jgi:hypothetical protein
MSLNRTEWTVSGRSGQRQRQQLVQGRVQSPDGGRTPHRRLRLQGAGAGLALFVQGLRCQGHQGHGGGQRLCRQTGHFSW